MRTTIDSKHPRGSVLLFTLVTLALLALMGFALVGTAITEVGISGSTNQGRQAFTRADATARLAILLARPILQPNAGGPDQYLNDNSPNGRPPFEIVLNNFTSTDSIPKVDGISLEEIKTRYLAATEANAGPQITLKHGGEVVGTAYITRYEAPAPNGEEEKSDNNRGNLVYLIISANGRLPRGGGADPGNYYDGSQDTKHTIVSTIYRDMVY